MVNNAFLVIFIFIVKYAAGGVKHFQTLVATFTDQRAGFFGRFSATVTNSSWRNLEFFEKQSLSFSENSLSFSENSFSLFKIMEIFSKIP